MTLVPTMLFYGGRTDSIAVVSGTWTETTAGSRFDGSWADAALEPGSNTSTFDCVFLDDTEAAFNVTAGHTLYTHLEIFSDSSAYTDDTTAPFLELRDSSDHPWLRLRFIAGAFVAYYNSGTGGAPVWTAISGGATSAPSWNARYAIDFMVTVDASGNHTVAQAINGTLSYSVVCPTMAGLTNIAKVRVGAIHVNPGADPVAFSQLLMTQDISTIGAHVKTIRASGAGTNTGWTGAYTDVNEAVTNDATFNQATSSALKQSYAMADIAVPSGYLIKGVRHCFRVRNDGANAPLNVQSLCRSAGTDYATGNLSGVGATYGPVSKRYATDPATSAAWTQSGVNAVELGFVSAA